MLALVLVFLAAAVIKLEAAEISCEKIDSLVSFGICCYLNETTAISEINVTMVDLKNSDIRAVLFQANQKIQFLPVNIDINFPN